MSESINQILEKLNPEQRDAVETIFGPVLVVAGPGTGKTQLLTTRIANILSQTDVNANNILCLTFTESGAIEMRTRLARWIGKEAYKVKISTFHGFCQSVMQDYSHFFNEEIADFRLADDLDRAQLYREIIDQKKLKHLKPFYDPYYYQRTFFSKISQLKRENFTPESFLKILPEEKEVILKDEKNYYKKNTKYGKAGELKKGVLEKIEKKIKKLEEFTEVWKTFETQKYKKKVYDFDDQILWVVEKIKNDEGLKAELQEQFQFVLVDEYQDTNAAQNDILWSLSDFDDSPNLFVVGDGDQSVYRFQGASLENILDFTSHYPTSKKITLDKNYRSAQSILDSAYESVKINQERLQTESTLLASGVNQKYSGEIYKGTFISRTSEIIYLAQKIDQMISEGENISEIAILVRENKEVLELATMLQKFGKFRISTRAMENIWEDLDVKYLILLLKVFKNPEINETFYRMLRAPFWNISGEQILNIHLRAKENKTSIARVLQEISKSEKEEDKNIKKIWETFCVLQKEYHNTSPKIILEKLWHYSGMANFKTKNIKEGGLGDLQKIKKFFDWLAETEKTFPKSDIDFILERIALYEDLNIAIYPDPLPEDKNAVQIMTAHRSKGMEFNHVFMPGLVDKVWGNKSNRDILALPHLFATEHDPNEDERRLFFVALTRAKKSLFLSYAETDFTGKEKMMSQFLTEIPENLITPILTEKLEEAAHKLLPIFLSPETKKPFTQDEKSILKKMAQNFVWSASSLQNFMECPLKFYYLNFLKIPTPRIKALGLGSAFHEVLENFIKFIQSSTENIKFLEDEDALNNLIKKLFKTALSSQNFTEKEKEDAFLYGFEILKNYIKNYKEDFKKASDWQIEGSFRTHIEEIPVYGRIDKIEILEEKLKNNSQKINVVDFKSGKPKNIKQGDRLWRQLVFYDLLITHDSKNKWEIEAIYLDFLTPKPNGAFEKKSLNITDEDREILLSELQSVHKNLLELNFPRVENKEKDTEIDYWQNFGK